VRDDALPSFAAPIDSKAEGSWARSLPKQHDFATYEVDGSAAGGTSRTPSAHDVGRGLLTWRIGPSHTTRKLEPDEDYPAFHVAKVDLLVHARGNDVEVALGSLSGMATPASQSYCKHRGFRLGLGNVWGFPDEPNIAAAFSIGLPQGSSDFLVVRDGGSLHVLHRETSDGKCDEIKQGPLETCEGSEYARVAEIHVSASARLFEAIVEQGAARDAGAGEEASSAFDCTTVVYGSELLPP
jgi:hypothetical protein